MSKAADVRRTTVLSIEGSTAKYTVHELSDDVGATLVLEMTNKLTGQVSRVADTSISQLLLRISLDSPSLGSIAFLDLAHAPPPPNFPSGQTVAEKFAYAAAYYVGKLSTADVPNTDHGNLACAWAVNYVVNIVLGRTIGVDELSTASMYQALNSGAGRRIRVGAPGCIVISPTITDGEGNVVHGHVGIVGNNDLIYSNSSVARAWEQNFTVETWSNRYSAKHLDTQFFMVN